MDTTPFRPNVFRGAQTDAHDIPAFVPRIDMHDIFTELIAEELRSGRLTPAARRRIVQYAAGMGLSAVQAGRLVEACRNRALRSADPTERFHALRLVEAPPENIAVGVKFALLVGGVILLDLLAVIALL